MANDLRISIKIDSNTNELKLTRKEIENVSKSTDGLEKSNKYLIKSTNDYAKSIEDVGIDQLKKDTTNLKIASLNYEKQLLSLDKGTLDYKKRVFDLNEKIKRNTLLQKEAALKTSMLNEKMAGSVKSASNLTSKNKHLIKTTQDYEKSIENLSLDDLKKDMNQLETAALNYKKQIQNLDKTTVNYDKEVAVLNEKLKRNSILQKETALRTKLLKDKLTKTAVATKNASDHTTNYTARLVQMAHAAGAIYAIKQAWDILVDTAKQFINTASDFEKLTTTLKTVEGSSAKAEKSMQWITNFASTTPYQIKSVAESFVKLRAYGIDPTTGTLKSLGDTASAMGKPLMQAVEAMADAVVGENERLKEFGIRANAMGDQVKYSWTNASGEARQAIVDNNSQVIQSTLEAIFNSKYAGAMEEQSKTWEGLVSNMLDKWTIFQVKLMDSGVFTYLKSIVTVVGEYMDQAFGKTLESSQKFALGVIDGIKNTIVGFGGFYDVLEGVADFFKFVWYSGETAFYGIQVVSSQAAYAIYEGWQSMANGTLGFFEGIANGVQDMFETSVNFAIDAINDIIRLVNSIPYMPQISTIGNVSYNKINFDRVDLSSELDTLMKERIAPAELGFMEANSNRSAAWDDLTTGGGGNDFANNIISKVDEVYQNLLNKVETQTAKTDFGDNISKDVNTQTAQDIYSEELAKQEDYTKSVLENYYSTTTDTLDKTTDSISKTNDALDDLSKTFVSNNGSYDLYKNTTNTIDTLNDFSDSVNNIDYVTSSAIDSIENFVFAFSDTLISSIDSNAQTLYSVGSQKTGFTNISYTDALAAANSARDSLLSNPLDTNIGKVYETAFNQLIDSANNYLVADNFTTSQDYAFAKASASSQIDSLQETALNSYSVLDSMNDLLSSINQAFSDGILSDAERADIKGVADNVNIKAQEYLVGNNSVSAFIKNLYGSSGKGISLESVASSLPELSVATGLDVSELSNIKAATEYATAGNSTSLKNLQVKEIDVKNTNLYSYYTTGEYETSTMPRPDATNIEVIADLGSTTTYEYYAKGGFTGKSNLPRDFTGERPIKGLIQAHEEEWIAPKWMTKSQPKLFNQLENARQVGSFASGGFTGGDVSLNSNSESDNKEMIALLKEIRNNTQESRYAS